jgi:uncharacterized membrane protein
MDRGLIAVGAILTVVGLLMVPLPGPGWLVASVGVLLLVASEAAALARGIPAVLAERA